MARLLPALLYYPRAAMKLTHIFWSLFIVTALIFLPVLLFLGKGKLNGGPEIFAIFLISRWAVCIISPISIILAFFKPVRVKQSFGYTLLFFLNLYFGLFGIYELYQGQVRQSFSAALLLLLLDLLWATLICVLITRSQINK